MNFDTRFVILAATWADAQRMKDTLDLPAGKTLYATFAEALLGIRDAVVYLADGPKPSKDVIFRARWLVVGAHNESRWGNVEICPVCLHTDGCPECVYGLRRTDVNPRRQMAEDLVSIDRVLAKLGGGA